MRGTDGDGSISPVSTSRTGASAPLSLPDFSHNELFIVQPDDIDSEPQLEGQSPPADTTDIFTTTVAVGEAPIPQASSPTKSIQLEPKSSDMPPGTRYKAYKIATAKHYPRHSSETLSFCIDSGAPITLVSEATMKRFFASVKRTASDRNMGISVCGDALTSKEHADIEVRMKGTSGQYIWITATAHVVKKLSCNLLIANDTIHPYSGTLDIGSERLLLGKAQHCIPISVRKELRAIPAASPNVETNITEETTVPNLSKLSRGAVPSTKRRRVAIYAAEQVVLRAGTGVNLLVRHRRLPAGKQWLFEPVCNPDMMSGIFASAPRCILDDDSLQRIPFSNFSAGHQVRVSKGKLIGYVSQFEPHGLPVVADICISEQVFMTKVDSEVTDHSAEGDVAVFLSEALEFEIITGEKASADLGIKAPFVLNPGDDQNETAANADVCSHWGEEFAAQMRAVIGKHEDLFKAELGLFNDEIDMPIPFRDETDVLGLKQNPYGLSRRDKVEMDKILDPLAAAQKIEPVPLGQPSAAASPAFIVWNKGKPRVVVDLRKVNAKLYPDAYPLPKQDDVLGALGGAVIFTSLDIQKSFFQQRIRKEDRWKTAFVTPHRGQEQMTVSTMGLANSPGFFQHRMESLLAPFLWNFVLVYIDDVVIFSRSKEDHLRHIDEVLTTLLKSGITLSATKCHFGYPSIELLGHHVSRLGITTSPEKIKAMVEKAFPTNLKLLECGIGLFNYYRRFIERFASIAMPLVELKKVGFRKSPPAGKARDKFASKTTLDSNEGMGTLTDTARQELMTKARHAWKELQTKLAEAPTLAYADFSKPFILYTDGSLEHGFGAAVHQVRDGKEVPILFLSRCLKPNERHYWATELETAALVWALQRVPQYFDTGDFEVITDHSALTGCLQNGQHGRRAQRLDEWALYLSTFLPRMKIRHRPGTQHANADALSRLHDETPCPCAEPAIDTFVIDTDFSLLPVDTFVMSTLQIDTDFRERIVEGLNTDAALRKIWTLLLDKRQAAVDAGESLTDREWHHETFTLRNGLMWHDEAGGSRVCVPAILDRDIFKMAHDDAAHAGTAKAYDRIHMVVFMPGLRKRLEAYIMSCPACQQSKPARHKPYGELQPLKTPTRPFQVLGVDFVTGLPQSQQFDSYMSVTCHYSKYIRIIPGQENWSAEQWADAFFKDVVRHHHLPRAVVSDRDSKFTGEFWQHLTKRLGMKTFLTAAHHPSADGQAERSNQTIEIAMRCMLVGKYEETWADIIPDVEMSLNSLKSSSTGTAPFEALYGYRANTALQALTAGDEEFPAATDFIERRRMVRKDLEDALAVAKARMAVYFNEKHEPPKFLVGDRVWLKLVKGGRRGYQLPGGSKLSSIRAGPYRIVKKVGQLAYELDLPPHTRIHPVISCVHLEKCNADEFDRTYPPPPPIKVDGRPDEYTIEKLVRQLPDEHGQPLIEVKWKGYGSEENTWEPRSELEQQVPNMIQRFDMRPRRGRPKKA
jgi:hypothetical protein